MVEKDVICEELSRLFKFSFEPIGADIVVEHNEMVNFEWDGETYEMDADHQTQLMDEMSTVFKMVIHHINEKYDSKKSFNDVAIYTTSGGIVGGVILSL